MSENQTVYTHLKPEEYKLWVTCKERISELRALKNKLAGRAQRRKWAGTHVRKTYQSPQDIKIARQKEKMAQDLAEYRYKKDNGLLEPNNTIR